MSEQRKREHVPGLRDGLLPSQSFRLGFSLPRRDLTPHTAGLSQSGLLYSLKQRTKTTLLGVNSFFVLSGSCQDWGG